MGAARLRPMSALVGHTLRRRCFENSLLEKGTADECEHTVARRVVDVNSALETCGFATNGNW